MWFLIFYKLEKIDSKLRVDLHLWVNKIQFNRCLENLLKNMGSWISRISCMLIDSKPTHRSFIILMNNS